MPNERLIPCLLIRSGGLYKTIRFKSPTYLGDPINAVKIFSDKEADEIIVMDIGATSENCGPDFELISDVANQAFMPVCYGGGVSTLSQMERLYSLGVEKVVLNSIAHARPSLVAEAAQHFGNQSVVVCLDCKKPFFSTDYAVYTKRGKIRINSSILDCAKYFESLGAGEIVLNNIDLDGTMAGYDHALFNKIGEALSIPVVGLGGACSLEDMRRAVRESGIAAAAGSLFSFRWPERAVLINYPKNRSHTPNV
jgi:imidazole glycerol-phosphate synthase subunit HisF